MGVGALMDPDVALATLRERGASLRAWVEAADWEVSPAALSQHDDDLTAMLDAAEALDEWLTKGGYIPQEWTSRG